MQIHKKTQLIATMFNHTRAQECLLPVLASVQAVDQHTSQQNTPWPEKTAQFEWICVEICIAKSEPATRVDDAFPVNLSQSVFHLGISFFKEKDT